MILFRYALTPIVFVALFPAQPELRHGDWVLPNFAYRVSVEVSNPTSQTVAALATVPIARIRAIAPAFPGRLAIAVLTGNDSSRTPVSVLPSQVDDLDGDGIPDTFEFPMKLAARQNSQVDIYYSDTLNDSVSWPKRVSAKHTYGYNHQVAALESELVGYRMYGGFFLDVQGRAVGEPGLKNDLAAYLPSRLNLGVGRDVLHIGDTLGLGGIFLRRNGRIFQPPMNVPDYAHKPSPEIVPHYRIVADGPLRAIVEATLDNWAVGEDLFRLRATYSIDAGQYLVHCRFEVIPLRLAADHEYEMGIGIRDLPSEQLSDEPGHIIVTGQQSQRDGDLGLAAYFNSDQFSLGSALRTPEGQNRIALRTLKVKPGITVTGEYVLAAAWSGSGIADPKGFLGQLSHAATVELKVGNLRAMQTPDPEKINAEVQ